MSVPNQRVAYINKTYVNQNTPSEQYYLIYHSHYFLARQRLSLNGMDAYMYLMTFIPHSYDFKKYEKAYSRPYDISPRAMSNFTGIDYTSCKRGINQLIEVGYLKLIKGNLYQFIDILPEDMTQTEEDYNFVKQTQISLEESLDALKEERQEQLQEIAKSNVLKDYDFIIKDIVKPNGKFDWE